MGKCSKKEPFIKDNFGFAGTIMMNLFIIYDCDFNSNIITLAWIKVGLISA